MIESGLLRRRFDSRSGADERLTLLGFPPVRERCADPVEGLAEQWQDIVLALVAPRLLDLLDVGHVLGDQRRSAITLGLELGRDRAVDPDALGGCIGDKVRGRTVYTLTDVDMFDSLPPTTYR